MNTVMACTCKHDFQDKTYGRGLRLFNYGRKINGTGGYRCTVCGATRGAATPPTKKEEK